MPAKEAPDRAVLMVPPARFGIEYEINPWMHRQQGIDRTLAQAQWRSLYASVLAAGAHIELAPAIDGLPDYVFTANAGLLDRGLFIPSQFTFPERRREEPHWRAWFDSHGYTVRSLPSKLRWEGEGDTLIAGELLLAGYGFRSELAAQRAVAKLVERPLLPLELANPWLYHLDTCLFPLSGETVFYAPEAFTPAARAAIAATFREAIPVPHDEANRFACNAVVLGTHVIMAAQCPQLRAEVESRGYTVHEVTLSEFLKSGGGAKCLTLHLNHPAAVREPATALASASSAR